MTRVTYSAHPGTATYPRLVAASAAGVQTYRVTLPPSAELFDAASHVARQFPGACLLLRLSAVDFARAALHVVEDGREGTMVAYGPAIEVPTACSLVAGHMTIGWESGNPICHCHGYLVLSDGQLLGGHLSRGRCVVGAEGAQVHLTVVTRTVLCPQEDQETGFRLLTPAQLLQEQACN